MTMAGLQKQTRVKFSGLAEREEDEYNTQDRFNKERKKVKPWFQRQFFDQKSEEDADLEFGAAIAAAAYAIMLVEEGYLDNKNPVDELGRSLTKVKSRREDNMNKAMGNSRISRWFSDKAKDDNGIVAGNSFKRKSSTLAEGMKEEFAADLKMKEKEMNSTPRIKKTPTFSDKYLNETGSKTSEPPQDWKIKQSILPRKTSKPTNLAKGSNYEDNSHSTNGLRKTYDWEQEKMEKIKTRNQKIINTILQWENEKKVKARRRKERKESDTHFRLQRRKPLNPRELEMRRIRILQEFHEEMMRIEMIASGARAVADDKRKNNELKVKEKAEKMRSTKTVHHKCLFF